MKTAGTAPTTTLTEPPQTANRFTTLSGVSVDPVYTQAGIADLDPARDLAQPGQFPYTRGIHPEMYRKRLWTMRQFSGFGVPEETNRRYHYLLQQGQTGLSVAFDLPTLMGYDADHPMSEGEVGKCGVSICSLEDMEVLWQGIPLEDISVSMTINSPAPVLWAMYLVAAEKQGADLSRLSGTLQNDILKEYIAQKEYIFPPRPSMRLVTDVVEYAATRTPKFNPISISGYHIREAGSTALQELAFTLRDGFEYVEWALERGLKIDDFAPRLSFFFNAHSDVFEEIAKYRAARKLWAMTLRDKYDAKDERSLKLRFHAQTAGCSLTWQQPQNNTVRTSLQAMSAVLGGAQSLHTNSWDEAYALPSEQAVTIALRTQQVIAHESGIAREPDPFGGSYFLERLTLDLEAGGREYFAKIDSLGGMIGAIEAAFPQSEIASASYRHQRELENREKIMVGVNEFQTNGDESRVKPTELLKLDRSSEESQIRKLEALHRRRDNSQVQRALDALRESARRTSNTMPCLLEAVRVYATLGEICDALRDVFGTYQETSAI